MKPHVNDRSEAGNDSESRAMSLQEEIARWHCSKWPDDGPLGQIAKLFEEGGELSRAVNTGRGSVEEEAADCLVVLMGFVGRHFDFDLLEATERRFRYITDPANGHRTAQMPSA